MGMLLESLAAAGVAVTAVIGATTGDRLLARELVEANARRVWWCTDDGSCGTAGFVTAALPEALGDRPEIAFVCGPEAMERAVTAQLAMAGVPAQVSLERLMACGIGACLSCVVATTEGQKRACCDGPVFDAAVLSWDVSEVPPKHAGAATS
jgi:dihydroorotate dehydrogenase electron transfer subunit